MKHTFAIFALAASCQAGDHSVCQYNLFVLGNSTGNYSVVQGRVAIGGDAAYNGYDFGSALTSSPSRFDVVVGGNLTFNLKGAVGRISRT